MLQTTSLPSPGTTNEHTRAQRAVTLSDPRAPLHWAPCSPSAHQGPLHLAPVRVFSEHRDPLGPRAETCQAAPTATRLGWRCPPRRGGAEERGGLPDEDDGEPPERLLPARARDHIRTQRQQVVRQGHVESEAEFQARRRDQSQLADDPGRRKVRGKPDSRRHLCELPMVLTLGARQDSHSDGRSSYLHKTAMYMETA